MPSSIMSWSASSNEETLPLAEFAATVFNVEQHPYPYANCAFDQLPLSAQNFLTETTRLFPLSSFNPDLWFPMVLQLRTSRQDRLGRTLEGVHRAIVNSMPLLSSLPETGALGTEAPDTQRMNIYSLQATLIPEWREHLDTYVGEIDALVWFENTMRAGTAYAQSEDEVREDRAYAVERMVEFVLQSLQMMNERVRREEMGKRLMARLAPSMGDLLEADLEGHVSDTESVEEEGRRSRSSVGGWSIVTDSDSDN